MKTMNANVTARTAALGAVLALGLIFVSGEEASAQDLVAQPGVQGFGGGVGAMQVNLQLAQAQKPQNQASGSFRRDPLQDFQTQVQRTILNQLSRQIVGSRFGRGSGALSLEQLRQGGTFELGNFVVDAQPTGQGLQIRVSNLVSGNSTVVTIPGSF